VSIPLNWGVPVIADNVRIYRGNHGSWVAAMLPRRRHSTTALFKALQMTWDRIVAATTNPDLIAVMLFCAIGLLIALNLILRFPDAGLLVEQYKVFPLPE
jgi:hypothetical protein